MSLYATFNRLIHHEAAGGVLLMIAAIAAMIVANSSFQPLYDTILNKDYIGLTYNGEGIKKPVILWVNDGLMAIFFFLIGLELKRELLEGKLKNPRDVILPGAAAIGGMALPAMIFAALNWGLPTLNGWAIPAATDIAFALGILALTGKHTPSSLKVFLLTLAILDDLGAILIIAMFYTAELKIDYLLLALLPLAGMLIMNLRGAHRITPIIILGAIMWYFVLKSGVHATLAGVLTAFFIPLKDRFNKSPLHSVEHGLMPYITFAIIPIFAFANAGVVLSGLSITDLLAPLPLGIMLGLVLGKQIGVFAITFVIVKLGAARLPHGANWLHIYGIAALAGVGFTMSLFIGGLSFVDADMMNQVRLGVLSGSILSGLIGFIALTVANRRLPEA
jgi:NhaA family Na+:H+ antiporter